MVPAAVWLLGVEYSVFEWYPDLLCPSGWTELRMQATSSWA